MSLPIFGDGIDPRSLERLRLQTGALLAEWSKALRSGRSLQSEAQVRILRSAVTLLTGVRPPSWLSWQSARLLTDRSLVRAQVRAFLPVGGTGGSSGTPRFTRIVRSYHGENVRSRPISETKHHWANSVLTWGTSWESLVLNVILSPHGVREPGLGNRTAAGSSPAGGSVLASASSKRESEV